MGASGWTYFTPYQADLQAALEGLRAEVFRAGEFYCVTADARSYLTDPHAVAELDRRERRRYRRLASLPLPQTIDELVKRNAEAGTHSILDITRVSAAREFGTVSPLSGEELVARFQTLRPTRAQVEAQVDHLGFSRWVGTYVVVYDEDGEPVEICFGGFSGD